MGSEVWLSILNEGLNYNGGRCKYIQTEKEKTRSFMNDSDDIPMIICWFAGSGKLKVWSLEVNRDLPSLYKCYDI